MLLAHLADIHLGYRQYGLLEREEDVYHAFGEAVEKIIQEHAESMLIAGDLLHIPRPPVRALYQAKQRIEKLKTRKIETYLETMRCRDGQGGENNLETLSGDEKIVVAPVLRLAIARSLAGEISNQSSWTSRPSTSTRKEDASSSKC